MKTIFMTICRNNGNTFFLLLQISTAFLDIHPQISKKIQVAALRGTAVVYWFSVSVCAPWRTLEGCTIQLIVALSSVLQLRWCYFCLQVSQVRCIVTVEVILTS